MPTDREVLEEIKNKISEVQSLIKGHKYKLGHESISTLSEQLSEAYWEARRLQDVSAFLQQYAFISFFEHPMSVTLYYTAVFDDEGDYQPEGCPDHTFHRRESENFWVSTEFYYALWYVAPPPNANGWDEWTTEDVTIETPSMETYLGHTPQHPLRELFKGYNHPNAEDWEKMWVLIKSIKPEFHNQGFALLEGLLEGSSDMRKALITNAEAKPLLETLDFLCGGMWMAYYYQDEQYDLSDEQTQDKLRDTFNDGYRLLDRFDVHSTILNLVNGWVERAKVLEQKTHNDT